MPTLRHCIRCGEHIVVGDRFCAHCGAEQPVTLGAETSEKGTSRWDEIEERLQAATEGRYHIRGLIGRGGMAAVYLADWPNMELRIAIKVMDPYLLDQETFVQRFLQEARTIAKLRHRHIIRVYDSGQAGDLFYFCMDYYPGRSMEKVLQAEGPIPIPVAKLWLSQGADALGYAHRQRKPVVHRDVKPSNMLLDAEGEVVLTDFGIAKVRDADQTLRSPALTMPGAVLGTPSYISPEQAAIILDSDKAPTGGQATAASDQYSLGVVGYEMLCGEPPFKGDLAGLCLAHAEREPPNILERRPDCPPELAQIVLRMMAKRPEDRWPNMEAARAALAAQAPAAGSPIRTQMAGLARGHKPVGSISVTPPSGEFFVGQSLRLTGTPLDLEGHPLSDRPLSWKSSDPRIAEVTPDGMVKGLQAGPVSITATADGVSGELMLAVAPVRVDTVVVLPSEVTIQEGEEHTLRTLLLSRDGEDLADREVVWTSNEPGVASVEGSGRVVGRRPGTTVVIASAEGRSGQATVSVIPVPAAFVEVVPNPVTLGVGTTEAMTCVPRDSNGNALEEKTVVWTVDDPSIVEVEPDGSIRGVAPGRAMVSAQVDGVIGTAEVSVPPERAVSLVLSPEAAEIEEEASLRLTATAFSASGRELSGDRIAWSSASPDIASVDAEGRVKGAKAGIVQITATCDDAVASAEVSVTPVPVAEIELLREAVQLELGDTRTLAAILRSKGGRALEGREIRWRSTAPEVAQVDESGLMTALAEGAAEIVLNVEGLQSSLSVTVVPTRVASLEISPSVMELTEEESAQVNVRLLSKDGRPVEGRRLAWTTDDPTVADVSPQGRITAASAGETLISVECEGHSASVNLRVRPTPVAKVVIDAPVQTLTVGDRERFQARTLDASGRELHRDPRWVSGDDSILEVGSEGWVNAVGAGTTELLATAEGVFERVWIEVQPAPVTLAPPPQGAVPVEEPEPPVEQAPPEPAVTGKKEEEPALAGVGAPARRSPLFFLLLVLPVVAVGTGVGIWMTRDSPPPPPPPTADVTVTTASGLATARGLELVAGDTLGLVATALTAQGDPVPDPDVVWGSSDPALATVDAGGTLVALAEGSLTVTARVDEVVRELPVTITAPTEGTVEITAISPETEDQPPDPETERPPTEGQLAARQDSVPATEVETPTQEVVPPAPDGRLQLRVNPWARVFINDVLQGDTVRRLALDLSPGEYRLHLENPGMNLVPFDTVFVITSNETTQLIKTLQERQ